MHFSSSSAICVSKPTQRNSHKLIFLQADTLEIFLTGFNHLDVSGTNASPESCCIISSHNKAWASSHGGQSWRPHHAVWMLCQARKQEEGSNVWAEILWSSLAYSDLSFNVSIWLRCCAAELQEAAVTTYLSNTLIFFFFYAIPRYLVQPLAFTFFSFISLSIMGCLILCIASLLLHGEHNKVTHWEQKIQLLLS